MGQDATRIQLFARRASGQDRPVSTIEITPEFAAKYRLGPTLGTGAMGMVFSGTRLADGEPCAIKFLTRLGDPEILARFLQEGRVLRRLEHPNVVRLLDMDTLQGHPYLVTELLEPDTLRTRLTARGRLPLDEAIDVALACLSALSTCHAADVVHRDVKPENVLFGKDGQPRLVDFGIAKAYGADSHTTRAGVIIGTPRYMPPELIRGGKPSVSADVYATGCTLYEMITGRAAFPQMKMNELLPQVMTQMPPLMAESTPDVPDWLEALVFRCLSKSQEERPATADELAARLRAQSDAIPALAEPVAPEAPRTDPEAPRTDPEAPRTDPEAPATAPRSGFRLGSHRGTPVAWPLTPRLAAFLALVLLLALALARAVLGAPGAPVICIDPGHPSEVSAGTRAADGTTETHVAWVVALELERVLTAAGYRVVKTKSREDQLVRNRRRAEIANEARAALMVRLHCDASAGSGFALYAPDRQGRTQGVTGPARDVIEASQEAARALHAGMAEELAGALADGGVRGDSKTAIGSKQGALTGSIFSKVPVVTIEMVVLTNASDAAWIRRPDGRERMARAIARGVTRWTRPPGAPPPAPASSRREASQ